MCVSGIQGTKHTEHCSAHCCCTLLLRAPTALLLAAAVAERLAVVPAATAAPDATAVNWTSRTSYTLFSYHDLSQQCIKVEIAVV
jgi:hypothetical protein